MQTLYLDIWKNVVLTMSSHVKYIDIACLLCRKSSVFHFTETTFLAHVGNGHVTLGHHMSPVVIQKHFTFSTSSLKVMVSVEILCGCVLLLEGSNLFEISILQIQNGS